MDSDCASQLVLELLYPKQYSRRCPTAVALTSRWSTIKIVRDALSGYLEFNTTTNVNC